MKAIRYILYLLPTLLVAAAPLPHIEDLIRQGNAAFEREDYREALRLYQRAEEATTDPGLVAFNEAAALYRLERYREAELHYRRSLEGAEGSRRARALYDLGNCLLLQSPEGGPETLAAAVRCYEECRECAAEPSLLADAGHNLELARLLWFKARKEAPPAPRSDDGQEGPTQTGKDPRKQPGESPADGGNTRNTPGEGKKQPGDSQAATQTARPNPGRGNLGTIPDNGELVPLAPEDTAAYLEGVAQRVARERREAWRSHPAPARNVKDW